MRTGFAVAPRKFSWSARYPCLETNRSGNVLTPFVPILSERTGVASAIRTLPASTRLSAGRLTTRLTTAFQKRPSLVPPTSGIRSELTRSPSRPSSAGSNVRAAAREVTPTRMAPAARLRMIVFGTISIPSIAITKAVPLKSTARLAVAPAASIAWDGSRPPPRSSR